MKPTMHSRQQPEMSQLQRQLLGQEHVVTQALLFELFEYEKETGIFTRKLDRQCVKKGQAAGSKNERGYLKIGIGGKVYSAHRLAWIYVHGDVPEDMEIDHINGVKDDNRIENLRLATHQQNMENQKTHATNKSGYKGVSWWEPTKKWKAQIGHKGKKYHIGLYQTKEEAKAAYELKAESLRTHHPKEFV